MESTLNAEVISKQLAELASMLKEVKELVTKKSPPVVGCLNEFTICVTNKPFRQTSANGPMILNSAAFSKLFDQLLTLEESSEGITKALASVLAECLIRVPGTGSVSVVGNSIYENFLGKFLQAAKSGNPGKTMVEVAKTAGQVSGTFSKNLERIVAPKVQPPPAAPGKEDKTKIPINDVLLWSLIMERMPKSDE